MELMKEKKFEKISIGELCDRAGVSRMTYYRSYNYKEDILLQHLDECFSRYMQGLDVRDFYTSSLSFFQFWQDQEREFLIAVVKSNLAAGLMDKFYAYLEEIFSQMQLGTEVAPYAKSFLAGGLYKMLIDWVKNGTKDSPEAMADFLAAGSRALTRI